MQNNSGQPPAYRSLGAALPAAASDSLSPGTSDAVSALGFLQDPLLGAAASAPLLSTQGMSQSDIAEMARKNAEDAERNRLLAREREKEAMREKRRAAEEVARQLEARQEEEDRQRTLENLSGSHGGAVEKQRLRETPQAFEGMAKQKEEEAKARRAAEAAAAEKAAAEAAALAEAEAALRC